MTNAVRYLATGSILALMSVLSLPASAAEGDRHAASIHAG